MSENSMSDDLETENHAVEVDDPLDHLQNLRLLEALLFASADPLTEKALAARLLPTANVTALLSELQQHYHGRGIVLRRAGGAWAFRTAPDLAAALSLPEEERRRLSRAAIETLAIIAYHQPVTRAEIETIRGVALSKGTLDILLEAGWIRPRGRRQVPGRPLTWGTTPAFLDHFGLDTLQDLPALDDLRAAGLIDARSTIANYGVTADGDEELIDTETDDRASQLDLLS